MEFMGAQYARTRIAVRAFDGVVQSVIMVIIVS